MRAMQPLACDQHTSFTTITVTTITVKLLKIYEFFLIWQSYNLYDTSIGRAMVHLWKTIKSWYKGENNKQEMLLIWILRYPLSRCFLVQVCGQFFKFQFSLSCCGSLAINLMKSTQSGRFANLKGLRNWLSGIILCTFQKWEFFNESN